MPPSEIRSNSKWILVILNFLFAEARGGLGEILEHKTMAMVMRYTHLLDEHKKKAIQLLDGLGF